MYRLSLLAVGVMSYIILSAMYGYLVSNVILVAGIAAYSGIKYHNWVGADEKWVRPEQRVKQQYINGELNENELETNLETILSEDSRSDYRVKQRD